MFLLALVDNTSHFGSLQKVTNLFHVVGFDSAKSQ